METNNIETSIKFSLVLCTLGRKDCVDSFLCSLEKQSYKKFECIIVDQNETDMLLPIVDKYASKFSVVYIRSSIKGLSKNRNIGVNRALGNVIAFPDDDCEYLPNTLEVMSSLFRETSNNIITINIRDISSERFFVKKHNLKHLDGYNYRPFGISMGIFVKYRKKSDVFFDEQLGVGSFFGADEESDLLSSLIEKNYKAEFHGDIFVLHPIGVAHIPLDKLIQRYRSYGLGYGALYKKEIVYRHKYLLVLPFLKESIGRLLAGLLPVKKRKLYMVSALARIEGFLKYNRKNEKNIV